MNVIFNGKILSEDNAELNTDNRAFLYGDGLFETMISEHDKILYFEDHMERLEKGMEVLKISFPFKKDFKLLENEIKSLLIKNRITNQARIKLIVWRKPGGLFSPSSSEAEYIITAQEHSLLQAKGRSVDFCNSVYLSPSLFSPFKRISSISYVLAGLEMKEKKLDDIILLDHNGMVGECLLSNIFWVKKNTFYTPSIETGCIEGVRRKNVIKKLIETGKEVLIVKMSSNELLAADYVFSTNVAGIYPIVKIGSKTFDFYLPQI